MATVESERETSRMKYPRVNVVLWDDDDHTFEYCRKLLQEIFHYDEREAERITEAIDRDGKAVVLTTSKELAELKRDQVYSFGADGRRIEKGKESKGSMTCTLEDAK